MPDHQELPPLPAKAVVDTHLPTGVRIYGYTESQMRAYALQAFEAGKRSAPAVSGEAVAPESGEEAIVRFNRWWDTRYGSIDKFCRHAARQEAWEAWQIAAAHPTGDAKDAARQAESLAMMIRMLVSSLKRHWPHAPQPNDLPSRAMELLRRYGLQGSPLRDSDDAGPKSAISGETKGQSNG